MNKDYPSITVEAETVRQEIPVKLPSELLSEKTNHSNRRVVVEIAAISLPLEKLHEGFYVGQILSLLQDLHFQETLPTTILFLNHAVTLLNKKEILSALEGLGKQKVEILISKTALEYYQLTTGLPENFRIVSNHEINSVLLAADLIVPY